MKYLIEFELLLICFGTKVGWAEGWTKVLFQLEYFCIPWPLQWEEWVLGGNPEDSGNLIRI